MRRESPSAPAALETQSTQHPVRARVRPARCRHSVRTFGEHPSREVCKAATIASSSGTVRHDVGTEYERALSGFGTHRELPANRRSAAEAIRRHAHHQRTSVADAYWLEYQDERIGPVIVNFADGTHCWVAWGCATTTYPFPAPKKRRRVDHLAAREPPAGWPRRRQGEVAAGECPCTPGLKQPLGSECPYDGRLVED